MTNRNDKVDQLMERLDHPHKDAVEHLRAVILAVDPGITEQVKWNAPSFRYGGDDRVTFQLKSQDVQLVFHRGAAVREDAETFAFTDDTGLMQWRTNDRAVVAFKDLAEAEANEQAFSGLVRRWIEA
ncbi:DUF1801 domain-containing protein [Glycomyces algeriensis]|uniref:YdhG-like domain-containing protein n=1 Tax=Glycomyces algeriensis TaxID=256037 RepID=A0A9W6LJ16_9ACTN|nr:DUF1801 domain-containing protein [Glycomyces algeriensis]MDA1366593.1 DUF1801 domain-containing protein [Glycomyces algeriensis]MDR7352250.1 hypothetical protein [Glycomyces algeriensis]GLI44985.1 hypothetical protein GALLR39Z86_48350 [Glycomyces algeriensis]